MAVNWYLQIWDKKIRKISLQLIQIGSQPWIFSLNLRCKNGCVFIVVNGCNVLPVSYIKIQQVILIFIKTVLSVLTVFYASFQFGADVTKLAMLLWYFYTSYKTQHIWGRWQESETNFTRMLTNTIHKFTARLTGKGQLSEKTFHTKS